MDTKTFYLLTCDAVPSSKSQIFYVHPARSESSYALRYPGRRKMIKVLKTLTVIGNDITTTIETL